MARTCCAIRSDFRNRSAASVAVNTKLCRRFQQWLLRRGRQCACFQAGRRSFVAYPESYARAVPPGSARAHPPCRSPQPRPAVSAPHGWSGCCGNLGRSPCTSCSAWAMNSMSISPPPRSLVSHGPCGRSSRAMRARIDVAFSLISSGLLLPPDRHRRSLRVHAPRDAGGPGHHPRPGQRHALPGPGSPLRGSA